MGIGMFGVDGVLGLFSAGIFMSFIIEAQQSFDWLIAGGSAFIIE